ncbi:cysteine--1-D-myo-inosityl 2-amino-2-deoxy-alpha-D-glucopyranoside ligase [Nakamurella endophytica]|uniref:L-cysteine:1D-myo-inositol 2-amino-2-deoxy-alpha-D-glucopyranoside ligase n=1 Tax=Nakamurella endophytica TaxID=1748367 RepID=A0A917SQ10_9ACTN|nr:cysteine--1-D-myo-inosityl 2-amino-2-deoxy-alpha-D-glucopyranoside ligase [Nakamurella endophytica]GGL93153.1 L-cysteine:1D-myo-inositol 2-amino-2-deoxy-alpha-D-glucopyranoside ligase [Nakamurella endophytica]
MRAWPAPEVPDLPGGTAADRPALRLYDSSSGTVRPSRPGATARLYVCGITPYDATHLGHAATYLAFDVLQRVWRDQGHRVHYVQNITDVDDPLLERADRDGVAWQDLAAEQIELFRADMTALRVLPPDDYIGAVEAMGEIAAAVQRLLDLGAAYRVDDADHPDVYFDISATGRFGYESRYDTPTMLALSAERGGDPDRPGKRDPLDPLLWRTERPGEPAWESPMGRGRAGWHVECAVIAGSRLGTGIDVQGGGSDLIFPHHECSAAHAEALTGQQRFADHYTHAAMIALDGEKMSKSRGNLVFVSRLRAEGVDPMAVRTALLSGHYRQDREWTADLLRVAEKRLAGWRAAARRPGTEGADGGAVLAALRDALADDLNTPAALAALDAWAHDDRLAGELVADAADALLGIGLR